MAARYNVFHPRTYVDRDKVERSDFMRCGVAFPLEAKDGFALNLYMVPPPQKDGTIKLVILSAEDER